MENNIITYNVNFNEDQIKQLYLLISGEKRCAVSMEEMVQYISQYASSIDPRCVISTCEDVKAIYSSLLNRIPTDEEYGYYTGKNTIEYVLCKTYLSKEHQTQKETFVSAADMHKILLSLCGQEDTRLLEEIANRNITCNSLVNQLLNYDEFAQRIRKTAVVTKKDILNAYRQLLRREPTKQEIEYYIAQRVNRRFFLETVFDSNESYQIRENENLDSHIRFGISCYQAYGNTYEIVFNNEMNDEITNAVREGNFLWEEEKAYIDLLPDSGTFVDIGANIGTISLMLGAKGWHGLCFEASRCNVECLNKSIRLNNYSIDVENVAIGDENKTIAFIENGPWGSIKNELVEYDLQFGMHAFQGGIKEIKVPEISLDTWEKNNANRLHSIEFIKMDIEGSEFFALCGMKGFLEGYSYPPILSEVNGYNLFTYGIRPIQLFKLFKEIGYIPYKLDGNKLREYITTNFQFPIYDNYLFLHKNTQLFQNYISSEPIMYDNLGMISMIADGIVNGWSQQQKHLIYTLQDFPELYEAPQIQEALYYCLSINDFVLQTAVRWYKEKTQDEI